MPGCWDLQIYRGDTGRWSFLLWADAAKTVPVDLAASTAAAQIRSAPGGTVFADFSCSISATNRVDVVLPAALSATLKPARAYWDLQITDGIGNVMTVLAGKVSIAADVTQVAA